MAIGSQSRWPSAADVLVVWRPSTPTKRRWTASEVARLPYDEWHRYEIIDGKLFVTEPESLDHQSVVGDICFALMDWNDATGIGSSVMAPGVIFDEDNAVIPDVVWIRQERLTSGLDDDGHLIVAPDLAVEVLSLVPSRHCRDYELKLKLYSRQGVREYWIVDWQRREIKVYRRAEHALALAETLVDDDRLETPLLPGFGAPITRFWPVD
jgi:Uma2 family endonuclease